MFGSDCKQSIVLNGQLTVLVYFHQHLASDLSNNKKEVCACIPGL